LLLIETQIATLRQRPGYMDPKHRDHDALVQQVRALYGQLHPNR
jgi:hypothetical protein